MDKIAPKKKCIPTQPFEASLRTYTSPNLNATKQDLSELANSANKLNTTVKTRREQMNIKKKEFSSTPYKSSHMSLACDVSSIQTERSHLPLIKEPLAVRNRLKSSGLLKGKISVVNPMSKRNETILAIQESANKKEKLDEERSAELNLLYCECIQATFLASKAKKSQIERDNFIQEKLTNMWKANQILMAQEKTLNAELERIKMWSQMLDYCKKEENLIQPLIEDFTDVMCQYKEISVAVDAIRHKLYTPGISPLFDSDFSEISEITKEIDEALMALLEKLQCRNSEFSDVENMIVHMFELIKNISFEIKKCSSMFKHAHSLMITETSLKIGEIELSQS